MFNPLKTLSLNLTIGLLTITSAFSADNPLLAELKGSKLFSMRQEKHSAEPLPIDHKSHNHKRYSSVTSIPIARTPVPIRYRDLKANHNINILLLNGCGGTIPLPEPLIFYTLDGRIINTGLRKLSVGTYLTFEGVTEPKKSSAESLSEKVFKNHTEFKAWLDDIVDGNVSS